ncbi:MAG: TauD/TfdA family dioxygenase [Burkholderiales bacterium]
MNAPTLEPTVPVVSPFDPDQAFPYQRWRDQKLANYPNRVDELVVELKDPRSLTNAEHDAIVQRCRNANMAIYASQTREPDKNIPSLLGRRLGLRNLDPNFLADDDGITTLAVSNLGERPNYIPYTNRPLKWHTDGYYNPPQRRIWAWLLHCVSSAASGGENALIDHEMIYLRLRDADLEFVRALMQPDAMTIPARNDEQGAARREETGAVFCLHPVSGDLHMRYTARTRSIRWKQDPSTQAAVAFLATVLASEPAYRIRLESGMGIVSNNVVHQRAPFNDAGNRQRTLYRARYHERIGGTESAFARLAAG